MRISVTQISKYLLGISLTGHDSIKILQQKKLVITLSFVIVITERKLLINKIQWHTKLLRLNSLKILI